MAEEQNKNEDEDELVIDLEPVEDEDQEEPDKSEEQEEKTKSDEDEDKEADLPDEPDEDELKSYSRGVRKRINKMTADKYAAIRAKEESDRQLEESIRFNKKLIEENNFFKKTLNATETNFRDTRKTSLEESLEGARAAHRAAFEAGDPEAITKTADRMAKLHAELQSVNSWQPRDYQPTEEPQRQEAPRIDPKVTDWQSRNRWFGVDTAMTGYAVGLHSELVGRGLDPRTDEYFSTVDKEMRKRFPDRFGVTEEKEEKKPAPQDKIVAPANRNSGRQSKHIRLTPSQVALAKRLGLSNEEYAREAMRLEQTND